MNSDYVWVLSLYIIVLLLLCIFCKDYMQLLEKV